MQRFSYLEEIVISFLTKLPVRRLIIFEHEDGLRSVYDIMELSLTGEDAERRVKHHAKWQTCFDLTEKEFQKLWKEREIVCLLK